ncbi:oligosaccharide flippase family protein [Alkalihalobacillus sp. AL-G]|uniref:oligosaccharide flippase family protein n=1 Tax=Alkalihalobacillus sp. AL-G TaxID=2926399 RepID=UPI00272DB753|nr:oligosaccharide flippase family protein [Alkalihalobacillus sp. AL-G]WLD93016.1 oligosaccharide flippase family protein [Alkalihalobacillus sp. AL-G]
MRELWVKILHTSGARVYKLISSLIVFVITARLLGAEGRGLIVAVITWVTLFSTVGHFSLGQVSIHRASQVKGKDWYSKTFISLIYLGILISLASIIIAFILFVYSNGEFYGGIPASLLIIGFFLLPLQIWEKYSSSLLMAIDKLNKYNKALIIGSSFNLLLTAVFVGVFKWGVIGALISNIISQIYISSAGLIILWKMYDRRIMFELQEAIRLFSDGFKLHLNAIGAFLINKSDILMLNHFLLVRDVGIYQFAYQLISILLIIPTATLSVFYSKMAQVGVNKFWDNQKKIMIKILAIIILISLIGFILAPYIIPFIAGEEFSNSINIFRLLLISLFGLSFSTLMANQWVGRGLFWQNSLVTIVSGLINITLNLIWIPQFGINGAAWATIVSTCGVTLLINLCMYFYCNKANKKDLEVS